MSKKQKAFNDYNIDNACYYHYFNKWYNIGTDIFLWENLPTNLKSEHIEKLLFNNGHCVFFDDVNFGYLCLPCSITHYNIMGDPIKFIVNSNTLAYTKKLDTNNSVLIKNNKQAYPSTQFVDYKCRQINNVDIARDINLNNLKTPFVFSGEKSNLDSFKVLFEKITGNKPIIYTEKNFIDGIKILNANAPNNIETFNKLIETYEDELRIYFGLKFIEDKKERYIIDEVNANDSYIFANRDSMFNSRIESIEKINEMFNLDISITKNNERTKEYNYDDETTAETD